MASACLRSCNRLPNPDRRPSWRWCTHRAGGGNSDRHVHQGEATVTAYYAKHALTYFVCIPFNQQCTGRLGSAGQLNDLFPVFALPTIFLIDPHGFVVGYASGAAEWDSAEARALIGWVIAQ